MSVYVSVNPCLRVADYCAGMAKRSKPGAKKGQPKPLKRTLDVGFRQRLAAAMKARGVGIPELAQRAECTRQVVHKYVNPKYALPKQVEAFLLFRIADALEISPRWLLLPNQTEMAREISPTPDQSQALNILTQLDEASKEQWFKEGEFHASRQPQVIATTARPFPNAKVKQ